jgi:hypothetical protein
MQWAFYWPLFLSSSGSEGKGLVTDKDLLSKT